MSSILFSEFLRSIPSAGSASQIFDSSSNSELQQDPNKGLETVKMLYPEISSIMNGLCKAMIKLTVEYEKKPVNNINKQFQDCIMNYFFEDFVGDLIKEQFPFQAKTQIKAHFFAIIADRKTAKKEEKLSRLKKYILLPQLYIQEIRKQGKEANYVELLRDLALEEILFSEGELRWRSQIRKKTFAVILLVHFFNGAPLQTIFEMWDSSFPNNSIKNSSVPPQIKKIAQRKFESRCDHISAVEIKAPLPTKKCQFNHYSKNFLFSQSPKIMEFDQKQLEQNSSEACHNSCSTEAQSIDFIKMEEMISSSVDNRDQKVILGSRFNSIKIPLFKSQSQVCERDWVNDIEGNILSFSYDQQQNVEEFNSSSEIDSSIPEYSSSHMSEIYPDPFDLAIKLPNNPKQQFQSPNQMSEFNNISWCPSDF